MLNSLYRASDCERALTIKEASKLDWRTPFRRDFARLLHSPAFRRLQGKTQLFAGPESDFFRNRLTHSIEVSQIATSIAIRLNCTEEFQDRGWKIDTDLVEFSGLAHDLGHPPFGHAGEETLNKLMQARGESFEGNAQTIRLLSRLEKKLDDKRSQLFKNRQPRWFKGDSHVSVGLNLCWRSLASVLKYDEEISYEPDNSAQSNERISKENRQRIKKGYYPSEASVVDKMRLNVACSAEKSSKFKTIECWIMDLADDIAYSTYDFEDALKANLLTPLDFLYASDSVLDDVAARSAEELQDTGFDSSDVKTIVRMTMDGFDELGKHEYPAAKLFAKSGFFRRTWTSPLVSTAVEAIRIERFNEGCPALTVVVMDPDTRKRVSVLKHLTYVLMVRSNLLQLSEHRQKMIISEIFEALTSPGGVDLLPEDFQEMHSQATNESQRLRVVCDFIAGMTDRYATEFFARLKSESFQTIFKPY